MKVTFNGKVVTGWKKYPLALLISVFVGFIFTAVGLVLSSPVIAFVYLFK